MDYSLASGILETCNTITTILLQIRKCYKARKKIAGLVADGLSSVENIRNLVKQVAVYVQLRGVSMEAFCNTVRTAGRVEDELTQVLARN